MAAAPEISPQELKRLLDAGVDATVLDVREPWEYAIAHVTGSINIPLGEVPARLDELDRAQPVIVMCKSGGRSRRAADFLSTHGFGQVSNLTGGIDAWSRDIDTSLPTY